MSSVKLININKSFDEKTVLENINIDIKDGEIVSLLGVSGCGKSTTLQLIAGLINPDSGDITFNDKSVLNIPTGKREAVIVFQDYLLFPHMSVYENIEFGLKVKNINMNTGIVIKKCDREEYLVTNLETKCITVLCTVKDSL